MARSFKDAKGLNEQKSVKKESPRKSAAEAILSSTSTKDARMATRINSATYAQFTQINKKLGASNGSVVNMLVAQYINDHKDLLD
ncbi:MAG: hypothetical protein HUJ76_03230 [Parasporobacterium sp.]|nr:hypothetical protein [Parasporobacterium sp.]